MDDWFIKHPKPERKNQHDLIIYNSDETPESDFIIVDIEFMVSATSEYRINEKEKNSRNQPRFIEEIRELLQQKQDLGLLDSKIKISEECKNPLFMFAYSYCSEKELEKYENHKKICKDVPTIYLPNGKLYLQEQD